MASVADRVTATDDAVVLSVRFSREAYEALRRLAQETGKSEGEILSDALAFQQLVEEVKKQGGRVLTERKGKFSEVVFA